MPSNATSRYRFCHGVRDETGKLHLTDRSPYRYHPHAGNRIHTVVEGDTLFDLAGIYFAPLERACGYWWVIADFQINPIIDPTLKLDIGRKLFIPATRILDVILSESYRKEHG